jgi:hypothetical protein
MAGARTAGEDVSGDTRRDRGQGWVVDHRPGHAAETSPDHVPIARASGGARPLTSSCHVHLSPAGKSWCERPRNLAWGRPTHAAPGSFTPRLAYHLGRRGALTGGTRRRPNAAMRSDKCFRRFAIGTVTTSDGVTIEVWRVFELIEMVEDNLRGG